MLVQSTSVERKCQNRALCDTFLEFGMLLAQVMRFPKPTGYKFAQPPWRPVAVKFKMAAYRLKPINHILRSTDRVFKCNTTFLMFSAMSNLISKFI